MILSRIFHITDWAARSLETVITFRKKT